MPAMLDDPNAPTLYRTSGDPPYSTAELTLIPEDVAPRQVTLRDRSTIATIVPFSGPNQVPPGLLEELCQLLNSEIEKGDTYPMTNPMFIEDFANYWFANFGAVMLLGHIESDHDVWKMAEESNVDWKKQCLGAFYIKPNYPGRSSHICNGGFLVSAAARNRGVGRQMGEVYLNWAPKLGYTYSVFNLVYETNTASIRIWDALGFKRIGRVKGAGNLKSHPECLVDAIIFGRGLDSAPEDYLNEERFDKIRIYLRSGSYPDSADRAEKGRLRSAAIHYRLIPASESEPEKLMLRDKEVISEPSRQFEIAHRIHSQGHGGINKTTAQISEKYHWVRIKETVSQAIKLCPECKEGSKPLKAPRNRGDNGNDDSTMYQDDSHHDGSSIPQSQGQMYPDLPPYGSQHATAQSHGGHDMSIHDMAHAVPPHQQAQDQAHGQQRSHRQSVQMAEAASYDYSDILSSVDPSIMGPTRGASTRAAAQQAQQSSQPLQGMQHYSQTQYSVPGGGNTEVIREVYEDGTGAEREERVHERQVPEVQPSQDAEVGSGPRTGSVRSYDRAFPDGE